MWSLKREYLGVKSGTVVGDKQMRQRATHVNVGRVHGPLSSKESTVKRAIQTCTNAIFEIKPSFSIKNSTHIPFDFLLSNTLETWKL